MRYCPNTTCPHRAHVGGPAEFRDRVARCSDCGTKLVASEEDARAGRGQEERGPYRAAGREPREDAPVPVRKPRSAVGYFLIAGGLALTLVTYALSSSSGGAYVVAVGPMIYGALLVMRADDEQKRRG